MSAPPDRKPGDRMCIYPFRTLTITTSGAAQPCCTFLGELQKDGRPMSVYEHSVDELWNSDHMRDIRRRMIEGEPVAGCELCYRHESRGVESMGERATSGWAAGWLNESKVTLEQLKAEAVASDYRVEARPEWIDLHVGSACNLKCRMCSGHFSSSIAADPTHSRWSPANHGVARWKGASAVIAPLPMLGVIYRGLGAPDRQPGRPPTAWTDGDATIRMDAAGIDLSGIAIRISENRGEGVSLKLQANGRTLFDGALPEGPWAAEFGLSGLAGARALELRLESSAPLGVEEVRVMRREARGGGVAFSRFEDGADWFRQKDFLYKDVLRDPARLRTVNLIGGEPLLIREAREVVRFLVDSGASKSTRLSVVTNLTAVDEEWCDLISKFGVAIMIASLDGFGPVNDYIRAPSRWLDVMAGLQRLRRVPSAFVYVNCVVQAYNALSLVDLLRYCDETSLDFHCALLDGPAHLSPFVLPLAVRREAARRLRAYAPLSRPQNLTQLGRLADALDDERAGFEPAMLREFMVFTNDMDASRGQDFAATFPDLRQRLEDAGLPWIAERRFA